MDEPARWRDDGYQPELSPWLTLAPGLPPTVRLRLLRQAREGLAALTEAVRGEPLWQEGLLLLARQQEAQGRPGDALETLTLAARLHSSPETLLPLLAFVLRMAPEDARTIALLREELAGYLITPEAREARLRALQAEWLDAGEPALAARTEALRQDAAAFFAGPHMRLAQALQTDGMPLPSTGHAG